MEKTKRVGIWIRVSTDFQVASESPEHHEQRGRYYAAAKGWEVVEIYRLDAISGKSVIDQPETKRMLKDVRSGHITGLIFSKLARIARNTPAANSSTPTMARITSFLFVSALNSYFSSATMCASLISELITSVTLLHTLQFSSGLPD